MPTEPARCSCEYPCSCVSFQGCRYPSKEAVIRILETRTNEYRAMWRRALDQATRRHESARLDRKARRRVEEDRDALRAQLREQKQLRDAELDTWCDLEEDMLSRLADYEHQEHAAAHARLELKVLRNAIKKHRDTPGAIIGERDLELYRAAGVANTTRTVDAALRVGIRSAFETFKELKAEPFPVRLQRQTQCVGGNPALPETGRVYSKPERRVLDFLKRGAPGAYRVRSLG